MKIAFCGHSKYTKNLTDEKMILKMLETIVNDDYCEFFLGEYGGFDRFAYDCAKKFKENHPKVKLIFITPYISVKHQIKYDEYQKERFDLIIYPSLEKVPLRYAISHRNRWIIEQADVIISFITHKNGGAYTMYRLAKRKNKKVYNIAPQDID